MRQTGCLSMLFNSFIFLGVFLPITYAVFWLLGTAKARYVWLTVTGYIFYGYWDPRFCLLMAASTLVSYTAGLGFLRWSDPAIESSAWSSRSRSISRCWGSSSTVGS